VPLLNCGVRGNVDRATTKSSALISAGAALPVATNVLLPHLAPAAHSQDYGAGLLAAVYLVASLVGGLISATP